jgi:pyruvate/2-oxoglutarate dehydrogenase complex dihydrolipoamide acyltransferase (E2) component
MNSQMNESYHPVTAPDLDLPETQVLVSAWLVPRGAEVVAGDRLVELLAGDVTVDVSAPVNGVLVERRIGEDQPVAPGQVLGMIAADAEDADQVP